MDREMEMQALQDLLDQDFSEGARQEAGKQELSTKQKIGMALAGLGDSVSAGFGKGGKGNTLQSIIAGQAKEKAGKLANFDDKRKELVRQKIMAKQQGFSADQAQAGRDFSGAQADKGRDFQEGQSDKSRAFQGEQADKGRSFQAGQNDKNREIGREKIEASKAAKVNENAGKVSEKNNKFIRDVRNDVQKKGSFKAAQAAYKGLHLVKKFTKNPNGFTDYGTLMAALKSMQGDESVIREAELRQGQNAASMFTKGRNAIQSAINGKKLSPEQRNQIEQALHFASAISLDLHNAEIEPIKKQVESMGLPQDQIFAEFKTIYGVDPKEDDGGQEIQRKTKDGRIAIFDENKKFLRYADE